VLHRTRVWFSSLASDLEGWVFYLSASVPWSGCPPYAMLGRVPTEKTVTWECVSIRCDPEDSWRDREPTCLRISRDRWTQFLPGVGMALIQQSVLE